MINAIGDGIARRHIGNMQVDFQDALNKGLVTLNDIKDTLGYVGLDLYMEDWFYELGSHDD